jgi:hypothetical protein
MTAVYITNCDARRGVYDSVNGNRLCGPNDIVFDREGNICR